MSNRHYREMMFREDVLQMDSERGPQLIGPVTESLLLFTDATAYCLKVSSGRCLQPHERERLDDAIAEMESRENPNHSRLNDWKHWRDVEMAFGATE